jgi:Protein of unknown function (DUF1553)/Protein of unknown function (DUF1549)
MRPRFSAKVLCLLLLAAGLGVGREGENDTGDDRLRTTSVADCTFERDPGAYLDRVRRHVEQLAADTEKVSAGRVKVSPARAPRQGSFISDIPHRNYIDDFIFGKMQQAGIPHAPLADDAEFFRRVNLDLTGRIPSAGAVRAFLASDASTKRNDVIRDLAGGAECTDKLTMYYGDLLKAAVQDTTSAVQNIYVEGRNAFYMSIKRGVEGQWPYDAFVRSFIAGEGSSWEKGELNWLLKGTQSMGPVQDHYDMMLSRAATQFLGLSSFDCLLCHDGRGHLDVLNAWGASTRRMQAWEMAAFFSRTRFPRSPNQAEGGQQVYYWSVADAPTGEYQLNTNSGNRTARTPVGGTNLIRPRYIFSNTQASGSTYREMFANNLVADRQFARATANYMWKYMMVMGIVEPADQFDPARLDPNKLPSGWTLQPSHPELLEALTDDFIGSGYNVRRLLTTIAESSAYQLSSRFTEEWQPEYTSYFARKFARRLWAEEVHDAIVMATGVPSSYGVGLLPTVQWAMQLPEASPEPRSNGAVNTFLNLFLRGNRDQNARSGEATILQALNMMNNTFVTTRLRNATAGSTVNRLLANRDYSDSRVVEELFLSALSRLPTAEELTVGMAALKANRVQGAENLMWVLLNKIDFLYNY